MSGFARCRYDDAVVTVASLFADNVAADPARPLLTWYGPAQGGWASGAGGREETERTELSGATLANWVAKTSNLLVDECGLGPGDVAAIRLKPHWQTASIMLACWTAGLAIAHSDSLVPDISFGLPGTDCDYSVSLHPLGLPGPASSSGGHDWVLAARAHGDHYGGPPASQDAPALVGLPKPVSHGDLARQALARAQELGISRGDRVLLNVDTHPRPLDYLVAPISAGASLVLCRGIADVDGIAATERATVAGRPPSQT